MRRMRQVMVGACVALAACGGEADGFETMPTTAWLETTTPSAPAESTTAPPSTTMTSTTTASTSPVATTVVEPTTTLSIEQDVLAGLAEIEANIRVCLDAPAACDPTTIAVINSPAHGPFAEMVTQYAADGLVVRDVGGRRQIVESVRVGLDGRSAVLHVCAVDGDWLVDPGQSVESSDDIVVDDEINSRRIEWLLVVTPDGWRRRSGHSLETWLGEDRCPAS